jgi:predicted nucleic acid-binding protein
MYTVDASVWVNGFDQREAGHEISRQFLDAIRLRKVPIIVPNLVLIEVAAAIGRTRHNAVQAVAFASALGRLPHVELRVLDEGRALQAVRLAAEHGLRGTDAVYAAVEIEAGCTLVSLDGEHLTRLPAVMEVLTPAAALAALTASPNA